MKVITFSQARKKLKSVLDAVVNLLRSPANAEHLSESIAQYKKAQVIEHKLIED